MLFANSFESEICLGAPWCSRTRLWSASGPSCLRNWCVPGWRSALAYRMDRRRWLQYERSQRAPDRCLFGAAPQRREEPAQRTSAFLSSREENGEDRCWSAALRLDRFRLAEAPARDYESVGVPRSCEHWCHVTSDLLGWLTAASCWPLSKTCERKAAPQGLIRLRDQIGMARMIRCCFVDRDTF